jgi:predicted small metal-binding protein
LPKAKVTKKGTVFYLHDKAVIKDDGNRFHVAANADQEVLTTALIHAKQRHGYQLSVQGNELFQENVVRASVKAGLNISFDQDHLERRRVQLSAEKLLFGEGALRNSTQQQSRGLRR